MVQTQTFEENLLSKISEMTIFDQFTHTIFVEENQGVIEVENAFRESNTLKFTRTEIAYQLKNHRIISKSIGKSKVLISDLMGCPTISVDKSICTCVSSDLNKLFMQELNRFKDTKDFVFNFTPKTILHKIFFPINNSHLIDKFIEVGKGMSWAIIPYNLLNIFFDTNLLKLNKEENEKIIYHLGTIDEIQIYINPDDESGKIFYGNYDSILILANKYMNIFEDIQGTNFNFEYLFIEQGPIRTLTIK